MVDPNHVFGMGPEKDQPGARRFETSATTTSGFWQDLLDFVLGERRKEGKVAPSSGVTKPTPEVETAEQAVGVTRDWVRDAKRRKGGAAMDGLTSDPRDTYKQRRFDFISKMEGVRTRAYDDATGKPVRPGAPVKGRATVGVGFNMDRSDAREVFKRATDLSDSDFDAVKRGEKRLTKQQVKALFNATVNEAEKIVASKAGDQVLTEHQNLALVSLAFNNPELIGPNLTKFIQNGEWNKAREEILRRSNRHNKKGIARRRYYEASMFEGPADAQAALPEFRKYMEQFA